MIFGSIFNIVENFKLSLLCIFNKYLVEKFKLCMCSRYYFIEIYYIISCL